jgi:uncharacterized protein (DUF1810 family)
VSGGDLSRFVDGYERDFDRALGEIRGGRKRSHWMWYVFPQIAGLGSSSTSRHYAIADRNEAEEFLSDARLGPRYAQLVDATWEQIVTNGVTVRNLFGQPDDQKLVSSLTLFAAVAADLPPSPERTTLVDQADAILDAAGRQGLTRCAFTRAALRND